MRALDYKLYEHVSERVIVSKDANAEQLKKNTTRLVQQYLGSLAGQYYISEIVCYLIEKVNWRLYQGVWEGYIPDLRSVNYDNYKK